MWTMTLCLDFARTAGFETAVVLLTLQAVIKPRQVSSNYPDNLQTYLRHHLLYYPGRRGGQTSTIPSSYKTTEELFKLP